jgi:predicted nucleic-acid-binding Zn-ribbon protein
MKKTRKCPKCEGREIYTNENQAKQGERSGLHIGGFRRFMITSYICSQCGFIEEYVQQEDLAKTKKMDKLRSKWKLHS